MKKVLLATYPCGCWGMVHNLPADAEDLAEFYKQVAKYNKASEKKKQGHRMLTVGEVSFEEYKKVPIGGVDRGCAACQPTKGKA